MSNTVKHQSSPFIAYLSRLRWINRWGLMRNAEPENVIEHSWEVAVIAHCLALIANAQFDRQLDAQAIATAALFHDASEVLTGDLPTPVKYFHSSVTDAYRRIEHLARQELLNTLPKAMQNAYCQLVDDSHWSKDQQQMIKAADTLSAYLKCLRELQAGNQEFSQASAQLRDKLGQYEMPEVDYFLDTFVADCALTLDSLLIQHPSKSVA
jgi:5'-deoxynucleotidase